MLYKLVSVNSIHALIETVVGVYFILDFIVLMVRVSAV